VAEANFRSARAVVVSARSALFPTVTTSPSCSNSRFPARQAIIPGGTVTGGGVTTPGTAASSSAAAGASSYNYFSLPLDVSYTVDLWHRVRNNIAADAYTAIV
jgi:outer membrane protein TolC